MVLAPLPLRAYKPVTSYLKVLTQAKRRSHLHSGGLRSCTVVLDYSACNGIALSCQGIRFFKTVQRCVDFDEREKRRVPSISYSDDSMSKRLKPSPASQHLTAASTPSCFVERFESAGSIMAAAIPPLIEGLQQLQAIRYTRGKPSFQKKKLHLTLSITSNVVAVAVVVVVYDYSSSSPG